MQASEKKKMLQGNLAGNIAILVAMTIALIAPADAQTWQPTIPVAVENTACNASTNKVGITADRTLLLSCQSGVWKKLSSNNQSGGQIAKRFGLADWPDYMTCYSAGLDRWLVYVLGSYSPSGGWIQYMCEGQHTFYIQFNPDGSAQGTWGTATDCSGQSIWQLKTAGRTW